MARSERTARFRGSDDPPPDEEEGDTPWTSGDVGAVVIGMVIGLLIMLALLAGLFWNLSEAFSETNAAGDAPVSWYQA
ncbi:hypothetical protein ACWCW7_30165 [Nocardia tengchongensis]